MSYDEQNPYGDWNLDGDNQIEQTTFEQPDQVQQQEYTPVAESQYMGKGRPKGARNKIKKQFGAYGKTMYTFQMQSPDGSIQTFTEVYKEDADRLRDSLLSQGYVDVGVQQNQQMQQPQQQIAAAKGFHGIVTKDTHFLVGEAGRERVDVTPITKNQFDFGTGDFDMRHYGIGQSLLGDDLFNVDVNKMFQADKKQTKKFMPQDKFDGFKPANDLGKMFGMNNALGNLWINDKKSKSKKVNWMEFWNV